jgi:macrolide transport system ATP-binding/permease protein
MDGLIRFFRKIGILIRREKFNSDLDEEMSFHRNQVEETFAADGMAPQAAHDAAARQFGNATRLKEQSHEMVGFRIESTVQDFRFAVRQLRKNPGFAVTAILILALGIGVSVAIFAFVDAALIKPLPYRNPARLVGVYESIPSCPRCNLSYPDYLDWKKSGRVFSAFDVWTGTGFLLSTPSGGQPVTGLRVTSGFFHTLGVAPLLGRDFRADEDQPNSPQTAILTYAMWQQRFGGRKDVIGQPITLSDNPFTIIGVLPPDFHFALRGTAELWTTIHEPTGCEKQRGCHNLYGVARLKEGISVGTALADMKSIAAQLETQYPGTNRGQGAAVVSLSEAIVGDIIRPLLLVLLSGAGLLLLIACVNISSLLLVRSENRRREMAVRGALGASRGRLVRQFVTEGLVLVVGGTALGLASAFGAMHLFLHLIPVDMLKSMPYLEGIDFSPRVLAFAGLVTFVAAILFSVTPSLRLSGSNFRVDLAEGGRSSSGTTWRRFASNLVVLELAIAVVLLAGAGLLCKSFYRLLHVDLGFQPDHLATLYVEGVGKAYAKGDQQVAMGRQLVSRLGSLPGVQSVGLSSQLPMEGNGNTTWIRIPGRPYNGEHNETNERDVNSDFFTTLHAKLLSGRFFTDAEDGSKPQVVIINKRLAEKYFPGEDPIGKKIGDTSLSPASMREVIGMVDDVREGSLDSDIWPTVYYPFNQSPDSGVGVMVRTTQDEESILPTMVAAIHRLSPNLATVHESTMARMINDSPTAYLHRSSAWLVGGFACLALLLGVVGLYGVIAYSVSQRTREIGVRMALGAQRSSVYQLILKEAGLLILFGIVAGLAGSIAAATLMGKLLFGVRSWDVPTLAAVAIVLAVSALFASYIPARRAASVNPVEALRAE